MKNRNYFIILLIAFSFLFTATACGDDDKDTNTNKNNDTNKNKGSGTSSYCCVNDAYYTCEDQEAAKSCFFGDMAGCTATPSKDSECDNGNDNKNNNKNNNNSINKKELGDACKSNDECDSNICSFLDVCTVSCSSQACPTGWDCADLTLDNKTQSDVCVLPEDD